MTDDEVKKFQKRARYVAIKRGFSELADDFAQEIFITFLENPERGATVDQLFIDYLRRTYGRPGKPGGDARIQAERFTDEFDDSTITCDDPEPEFERGRYSFLFGDKQAEIYEAYFVNEMTEKWIAERLGVTESCVSQKLSEMKKKIIEQVELEDLWERFKTEPEFTRLEIQWIRF